MASGVTGTVDTDTESKRKWWWGTREINRWFNP